MLFVNILFQPVQMTDMVLIVSRSVTVRMVLSVMMQLGNVSVQLVGLVAAVLNHVHPPG